jgi:hypothetical protein
MDLLSRMALLRMFLDWVGPIRFQRARCSHRDPPDLAPCSQRAPLYLQRAPPYLLPDPACRFQLVPPHEKSIVELAYSLRR